MKLKENDNIPNSEFFIMEDGNPTKKNTHEFYKDKKIVLFGLPGAYTSVCSAKQYCYLLCQFFLMHQSLDM